MRYSNRRYPGYSESHGGYLLTEGMIWKGGIVRHRCRHKKGGTGVTRDGVHGKACSLKGRDRGDKEWNARKRVRCKGRCAIYKGGCAIYKGGCDIYKGGCAIYKGGCAIYKEGRGHDL